MIDIKSAVQTIMTRTTGIAAEVERFTRLSGGASADIPIPNLRIAEGIEQLAAQFESSGDRPSTKS
jgi:hypothetical protein